jgi:long-subunit fatty acid transport protein
MIKKIIVSFCLLISLSALAQEGTSTPYSFYGIGDIRFKGTNETRSMGGLSVFPDSIHINLQNPAHFASLKLTTFSIGGTHANTKSKSETQEEKSRRTAFDYLAVGVPIGKLGLSFGLIPYSSVGYKIKNITYFRRDTAPFDTIRAVKTNYRGEGGVNKVFFGLGYKLNKNFNIGADIQYNFGSIETTNLTSQSGIQYGTREINTSNVQGFNADFGLTYQTQLNKKLSFFSSLVYSPESELRLDNTRQIQLTEEFADESIRVIQSEDVDVANTVIKIPSKLSFGSGFGEVKKWLLGAEVTLINNSVMSNRFLDINGAVFENSVRYSVGGYFIPNYNSYSKYFKRITYRAGLRYENTGLVIVRPGYENKSITDTAFNVGFGLPLGGSFSKINIGIEMGRRGTIYNNLVEENYFNVSIGLSLSDKWFVKRKYD